MLVSACSNSPSKSSYVKTLWAFVIITQTEDSGDQPEGQYDEFGFMIDGGEICGGVEIIISLAF